MPASAKPKLEVTVVIEQEPKSKGGRRFGEEPGEFPDGIAEVFGRLYLNQDASKYLGGGNRFKVTIEPA